MHWRRSRLHKVINTRKIFRRKWTELFINQGVFYYDGNPKAYLVFNCFRGGDITGTSLITFAILTALKRQTSTHKYYFSKRATIYQKLKRPNKTLPQHWYNIHICKLKILYKRVLTLRVLDKNHTLVFRFVKGFCCDFCETNGFAFIGKALILYQS